MAKEYSSISMPATPAYPDGSFEVKVKKGFKKIFSFGKKKDGSLGKSRSGSERGSSSRVEEDGQRSSRRFGGLFKRSKNRPVDNNPADNFIETPRVSVTGNAQQTEDGEKHSLMEKIKDGLHIHTNRHSEPAPKEEHKPPQLADHRAGNTNKHELKKPAEAEARGHAVNKDPSPAHGEANKLGHEKEGKTDQHQHHQHKDGEAPSNLKPEASAGEKKPEDASGHPLEVKESNGCEILGKGLQRVCLPWTLNKDE